MNRSLIIVLIAITVALAGLNLATMSEFHQRVSVRATPILGEAKREVLTTSQEQSRSVQEINSTMGLQFMKSAQSSGCN